MSWAISFDDVKEAKARIGDWVLETPLLQAAEINCTVGADVYVKAECLQFTGSFKARGAANRLLAIAEKDRPKGVVAFSSGNHGQAVAFVASRLGMPATIVMPSDAPAIKIERTRSHGAEIILYDRQKESREEIAEGIARETGAILVPSFEDEYIMAGQGTAGLEAIQQLEKQGKIFDAFLVCTGGGGLLSGICTAFHGLSQSTALYSAEPEGYDDWALSFKAGKRMPAPSSMPNICDAILTPMPGEMPFEIARDCVKEGLVVTENDVRNAIRFAADYLNIVAEPGGAVALAALLSGKLDVTGKVVGLTVSGGNIDRKTLSQILAK